MKEPLRAQIRRHVTENPDLTAYAIARAISRGQGATFQALCRMEHDGLVEHTEAPRTSTDRRPAIRWSAT